MDRALLTEAFHEWNNFEDNLNEDERKGFDVLLLEPVETNKLHYYFVSKDYTNFDLTLNRLSPKYLYDEEVISTIFNCFLKRHLYELAFDYLNKSEKYYKNNALTKPDIIRKLRDEYPDEQTIQKIKLILGNLPSQRVTDIPRILPSNINGYLNLNEFILYEVIQAIKVMMDKIESVREIQTENRYNDLLLAILRLRLPLWGWIILDQPRAGKSPGGKDAGEVDHLINASGNNIALFESFILKDKRSINKHIIKCKDYINYLDRYYIIIFFLKKKKDFAKNWAKYKKEVLAIEYPPNFLIDIQYSFEDLCNKFKDINDLKIAKTIHDNKIEMFHIMINLGN